MSEKFVRYAFDQGERDTDTTAAMFIADDENGPWRQAGQAEGATRDFQVIERWVETWSIGDPQGHVWYLIGKMRPMDIDGDLIEQANRLIETAVNLIQLVNVTGVYLQHDYVMGTLADCSDALQELAIARTASEEE